MGEPPPHSLLPGILLRSPESDNASGMAFGWFRDGSQSAVPAVFTMALGNGPEQPAWHLCCEICPRVFSCRCGVLLQSLGFARGASQPRWLEVGCAFEVRVVRLRSKCKGSWSLAAGLFRTSARPCLRRKAPATQTEIPEEHGHRWVGRSVGCYLAPGEAPQHGLSLW